MAMTAWRVTGQKTLKLLSEVRMLWCLVWPALSPSCKVVVCMLAAKAASLPESPHSWWWEVLLLQDSGRIPHRCSRNGTGCCAWPWLRAQFQGRGNPHDSSSQLVRSANTLHSLNEASERKQSLRLPHALCFNRKCSLGSVLGRGGATPVLVPPPA